MENIQENISDIFKWEIILGQNHSVLKWHQLALINQWKQWDGANNTERILLTRVKNQQGQDDLTYVIKLVPFIFVVRRVESRLFELHVALKEKITPCEQVKCSTNLILTRQTDSAIAAQTCRPAVKSCDIPSSGDELIILQELLTTKWKSGLSENRFFLQTLGFFNFASSLIKPLLKIKLIHLIRRQRKWYQCKLTRLFG